MLSSSARGMMQSSVAASPLRYANRFRPAIVTSVVDVATGRSTLADAVTRRNFTTAAGTATQSAVSSHRSTIDLMTPKSTLLPVPSSSLMNFRAYSSTPTNMNPQHPQYNPQGEQQQQQSHLAQYSVDLTELAKNNKLDPIIGRHEEIRRCLQILARKTKNNPILIGEAGVGKTAVAEGLAQRIVSGEVPESMKDKKVIRLDVTALLSGAMFRGQFEERLQNVIKEVQEQHGKIILFIDEIHTVVGAGGTGGGGGQMDMSNMLKPALARGELQLLGATTLNEYRVLEKDAALARRFQSVYVKEPSIEDTLSILRGLKSHYELHHSGIRIHDEALVQAATLSDRYMPDRKQPDKSIDLVDEACSRLRLEQESKPEIIWQIERELLTKQMELSALQQEHDVPKSVARKEIVEVEVNKLKKRLEKLTKLWEDEKNELSRAKTLKEELEQTKMQMEQARRQGDYNRAGELLHSKIPKLQHELDLLQQQEEQQKLLGTGKKNKKKKSKMLADAVTADAIATIIARHTGIPVSRITGSESKKLLHVEDHLRKRVVGQDHALEAVSNCVRLARTRLQAQHRTLGNFLFLGPTGVGKTELCKALAEFIFDDKNAMTRIDMSEYTEKHTISRLIGAPPGYVGYDEGGILTESIRRRPYQVLLLDEFEKGHKDVWNLLLQLFDEGFLTDSHGNKVDFQNCIVVMTSNIGAQYISELPTNDESYSGSITESHPEVQNAVMDLVRSTMSPELFNRIDETIIFNRLQREHMDRITEIGITDIQKRLYEGQNMTLNISDLAKQCLAEQGYDPRYGARPLKRVLARQILNPLSRLVLEGSVLDGDIVNVCTRGEAEKQYKQQNEGVEQPAKSLGWICSNDHSESKNDVVIMRNHEPMPDTEENDEEDDDLWGEHDEDSDDEDETEHRSHG